MIKRTPLYVLLLLSFFNLNFSLKANGKNEVDSLLQIIDTTKEDTIKAKLYLKIGKSLAETDLDSTIYYCNRALYFATEASSKKYMAHSNSYIGYYSRRKTDYDKALEHYFKALEYFKELKNDNFTSKTYHNIANAYLQRSQYEKSIEYLLKSIALKEKINDSVGIANSQVGVGNIYFKQKNYDKAIEYYKNALEFFKETGEKLKMAMCYNNIGSVHLTHNRYEEAKDHFLKTIEISKEVGYKQFLGDAYSNIGLCYKELGNKNKTKQYFNKALNQHKEIGDKRGLASVYNNFGGFYNENKQYKKAIEYANMSQDLANRLKIIEIQSSNSEILYEVYEELGDFKKALEYHKKFKEFNDSIFNVQSEDIIQEMQAKYEVEQKENEIKLQQKELKIKAIEIKRKNTINYIFFISLVVAIIFIILIIKLLFDKRKKNKLLLLKNHQIGEKNQVIEKVNKQMFESIHYAKQIQQAVFLAEDEIKKYFKDAFILNLPRDIVSGDFFWIYQKGNTIIFALVDCTGHGVPGAFMSFIGNSLLNEIVKEKGITQPAKVLTEIHSGVQTALRQESKFTSSDDGMDMVLCNFDTGSYELQFAGARNTAYIINNDSFEVLAGNPFSIGENTESLKHDVEFTNKTIKIKEASVLYLTTDGYMSQFGGTEEIKLNLHKFESLLKSIHPLSMTRQKELMFNDFIAWKGDQRQIDDVMVVGVKL